MGVRSSKVSGPASIDGSGGPGLIAEDGPP